MAPITRLAIVATLFFGAIANAAPYLAPSAAEPAFTTNEASASPLYKRAGTTIITQCSKAGTLAMTFDDGPYDYTNGLLDILKKKGVKATFAMNGNNYGNIYDFAKVVKRVYSEGHQIFSHTWDHADLATLSKAKITTEMTKLDAAFKSIIGVRPIYMRPPYGSTNALVLSTLSNLGYKIVTWDEDTEDWQHPTNVTASFDLYKTVLSKSGEIKKKGHIFLEHDVNSDTALLLAPQAIDLALSKGFKVVTVGTCLGTSQSSWYRK